MECPEVFYTYEWALAVSRAHSSSISSLLILAYDQDSLVGVVALATDSMGRGTFFLTSTTADYCDFISAPANRADFVSLVFEELRRLRIPALVAANLPADSVTSSTLAATTEAQGYRAFSRLASRCSQITLGSFAERRALRDVVANRKALRYSLKGLEGRGPLSIDHLESAALLQTALPEFIRAHIARFSAAGRRSNLSHPERQVFLIELVGCSPPRAGSFFLAFELGIAQWRGIMGSSFQEAGFIISQRSSVTGASFLLGSACFRKSWKLRVTILQSNGLISDWEQRVTKSDSPQVLGRRWTLPSLPRLPITSRRLLAITLGLPSSLLRVLSMASDGCWDVSPQEAAKDESLAASSCRQPSIAHLRRALGFDH